MPTFVVGDAVIRPVDGYCEGVVEKICDDGKIKVRADARYGGGLLNKAKPTSWKHKDKKRAAEEPPDGVLTPSKKINAQVHFFRCLPARI